MLVHHADAAVRYVNDRTVHFGKLDRGLEEAPRRNSSLISAKDNLKRILRAA